MVIWNVTKSDMTEGTEGRGYGTSFCEERDTLPYNHSINNNNNNNLYHLLVFYSTGIMSVAATFDDIFNITRSRLGQNG